MTLSDFIKSIQDSKRLPKNIRFYIVLKKHFFINNGLLKKGFNLLKKDMDKSWKNLLEVYVLEQEKTSWDKLSKELKL